MNNLDKDTISRLFKKLINYFLICLFVSIILFVINLFYSPITLRVLLFLLLFVLKCIGIATLIVFIIYKVI